MRATGRKAQTVFSLAIKEKNTDASEIVVFSFSSCLITTAGCGVALSADVIMMHHTGLTGGTCAVAI